MFNNLYRERFKWRAYIAFIQMSLLLVTRKSYYVGLKQVFLTENFGNIFHARSKKILYKMRLTHVR